MLIHGLQGTIAVVSYCAITALSPGCGLPVSVCRFYMLFYQADVAGGYKETQKMIDELMKMRIPDYKPSSNHVFLSENGKNLIY